MLVWILWIAGENVMILEEVRWAMFEDSEEAIEAKMVSGMLSLPSCTSIILPPPFTAANPACLSEFHVRFPEACAAVLRSLSWSLTWKWLQRQVRLDVMAAANHNCIKDSMLLLAIALSMNFPLPRRCKIWASFHTNDGGLEQTQRRPH